MTIDSRLKTLLTQCDALCDRVESHLHQSIIVNINYDKVNTDGTKTSLVATYLPSVRNGIGRACMGTIQIVAAPIIFTLGILGLLVSPILGTDFGITLMRFGVKQFCHGFLNVLRVCEIIPVVHLYFISVLNKRDEKYAGVKYETTDKRFFYYSETPNHREVWNQVVTGNPTILEHWKAAATPETTAALVSHASYP